jgi:hypothetical protein
MNQDNNSKATLPDNAVSIEEPAIDGSLTDDELRAITGGASSAA